MALKSEWGHTPREAVMATVIQWDDGLGVSYSYHDGAAEAHAIGPEYWPVIHALERASGMRMTSMCSQTGSCPAASSRLTQRP